MFLRWLCSDQEGGLYGVNADRVCIGVGFVFHILFLAIVCWYVAASVSLLATVWKAGKYRHFSMHFSRETFAAYHIVIWSFVVLNSVIVWSLTPLRISFGALFPWTFCWCRSINVLYGAFFSVALLALALNLIVTIILVVYALQMARSRVALVGDRSNTHVSCCLSAVVGVVVEQDRFSFLVFVRCALKFHPSFWWSTRACWPLG